jgi:capsular polysaccharide export protein
MKQYPPRRIFLAKSHWRWHPKRISCGSPSSKHSAEKMNASINFGRSANRSEVAENTCGLRTAVRKSKALLLQGPVGPFFTELQSAMTLSGWSTRRVIFNTGDQIFSSKKDFVRLTGDVDRWESWLRLEISQNRPDCIILFGSSRPAHKVARRLAELFGIYVLSLEEGYLRSGYVSVEQGGNNQHSPLVQWTYRSSTGSQASLDSLVRPAKSSFAMMSVWGAIYYLTRDLLSRPSDQDLFHRPRESVLPLSWRWSTHMLRRATAWITEVPLRRSLQENSGFIIVPLQVSNDSQIQKAARGWTTPKLVDQCLMALAQTNPRQTVVFKLHPLECSSNKLKRMFVHRAKALGIDHTRYKILHTGRIGDLTAHSSGMVVINSTSAFSALHYGVPLLVLGDAIYRHEEIATIGTNQNDILNFFQLRRVKSGEKVAAFFEAVKSQSLLPGDFYVSAGRKEAIRNIVQKLNDIPVAPSVPQEAVT